MSLPGSKAASTDDKDLTGPQREKRLAPQPPGRNQAEGRSQREPEGSSRHPPKVNKQSNDREAKTGSTPPHRSVQRIAPLSRSPADAKTQSSATKGATDVGKHGKRLAPSAPQSSGPKTGSTSNGKTSQCGSGAKQEQIVYGLNPFEDDDDDENELAAQDYTPANTSSVQWPPAASQPADKDATTQPKIKSTKTARAPPLPTKNAAASGSTIQPDGPVTGDSGVTVPGGRVTESCAPEPDQQTPVKEARAATVQSAGEDAGRKKEGPPATQRR